MVPTRWMLFVGLGGAMVGRATARVNATSAFDVLATTACEACTIDYDSIWCAEGTGFIYNSSTRQPVNVAPNGDDAPGPFCWAGTFGEMLQANGNYTNLLGSPEWVIADLQCKKMKIFYNQCIIPATVAIILMVIGGVVCCSLSLCTCVCLGCCRCGSESNYGCCNAICPSWWPCCVERGLYEKEDKGVTEGQMSMFSTDAKIGDGDESDVEEQRAEEAIQADHDGGAAAALMGLTASKRSTATRNPAAGISMEF